MRPRFYFWSTRWDNPVRAHLVTAIIYRAAASHGGWSAALVQDVWCKINRPFFIKMHLLWSCQGNILPWHFVPLLRKMGFVFFPPHLPHIFETFFSNLVLGVSEQRGHTRWSINTTCRYKCSSVSVDKGRKWSWIPSIFWILSISRRQLQKWERGKKI